MMRRAMILGLAVAAATSCATGARPSGFGPAKGPAGVTATLYPNSAPKLEAEVLAVQDSGLLVVARDSVLLVPWSRIRRGIVPSLSIEFARGDRPRTSETEAIRRTSRYPQGVSDELLAKLLQSYGQAALRTVGS